MTGMSEHPKRRDHLWVLFVIAACVLAEVWASWVGIGAISGFPRIDGIPTDWVLAVSMEAYWGYALYAWLVTSPGPRSRMMAMWSCGVVFAMSLAGQVLYHELTVPPGTPAGRRAVVGFVTSLPVIVLALIAVLIHLRHADREEAAAEARAAAEAEERAAAERAEAGERTALREALDQAEAALEPLRAELASAREDLAAAHERAEALAQKVAALSARKPRRQAPANAQGARRASGQDDDMTTELRALMELKADPELRKPRMGGELARRLGVSPATGRRLHARLTAQDAPADPLGERSPEDADDRSGERS